MGDECRMKSDVEPHDAECRMLNVDSGAKMLNAGMPGPEGQDGGVPGC